MRAFHENPDPDRIYILNSHILNLKAHTCITIKSHAYAFAEIFEASSTNSVDPDLTAPVWRYTYVKIFGCRYFAGVLRAKSYVLCLY